MGGNDIRQSEPIRITGAQIPELTGVPVDELFVFAWDGFGWMEVLFQIDERAQDGSFFLADDGMWDDNDEMLVHHRFPGTPVLVSNWIADQDSRNYSRIRIDITDPVLGGQRTLYIYRSSTLTTANFPSWINYDETSGEISSAWYTAHFDPVSGLWDELWMDTANSGMLDWLDREKLRVQGQLFTVPYTFDENDFVTTEVQVIAGRLRVLRQVSRQISILGNELNLNELKLFYPAYVSTQPGSISVDPSLGVASIRLSQDMGPDIAGGIFADPNNNGILVDGQNDANIQTSMSPSQAEAYWSSISLDGISFVTVARFAGLANQASLYYHDASDGSTADGTADTGDLVSFGDHGVMLEDFTTGTSSPEIRLYLGASSEFDGPMVQRFFLNPFQLVFSSSTIEEGFWALVPLWTQFLPDDDAVTTTIRHLIEIINVLPVQPR